jgi:transposase-like protein
MALPRCPKCGSYELDLLKDLDDGRKHLKCDDCGEDWLRGEERLFAETLTHAAGPAKTW